MWVRAYFVKGQGAKGRGHGSPLGNVRRVLGVLKSHQWPGEAPSSWVPVFRME